MSVYKLFHSICTRIYWHFCNLFDEPIATEKGNTDNFDTTSKKWDIQRIILGICAVCIFGRDQWDENNLRKMYFRYAGKHWLQLDDTCLGDITCEMCLAAVGFT